MTKLTTIKTLGALKASKYISKNIKEEMRANLISKLKENSPVFEGIHGYETTVIPDLKRAILSKHNISFLGLRGQAKTRIARSLTQLLDEYIPVLEGSELNEDPLNPLTAASKEKIENLGDKTPIFWMHRDERYSEKLATPDVSIADIIGDIDPIKAANLKLSFADERVIHYGMVPRSNRCIFVINEIPDLQARIQVALFNILQEGDFQIRGFKIRLPLDIAFVFTANPEDYTNRGSIVTPLKDRIGSQILTHYPTSREISKKITLQEAKLSKSQLDNIEIPELVIDLIEQIAIEARKSEFVDAKSGVSARLTIAAYENAVSAAELRMLMNKESKTFVRITDLIGVIPAINGKIELVYEGETEGVANVAKSLLSNATRTLFAELFPNPKRLKKQNEPFAYQAVIDWFAENQSLELPYNLTSESYLSKLDEISGLSLLTEKYMPQNTSHKLFIMEFILHGMAEFSLIHKIWMNEKMEFGDLVGDLISGLDFESE